MHKDNRVNQEARIERGLKALSVGSYLFQCQVAASLALHPTDLQALHTLGNARGGLPAGELGDALGLTSGATTALIDRLVNLGYAQRTRDAADRRRVIVELSEDGTAPLKAKYRAIDQRVRKLMADRSASELRVIADFLAELTGSSAG
jgi:DNA-binding MarR family transcriptional regulator